MNRRVIVRVGVLIAVVYVGAAAVSAHLDPLASRPLLDGLSPPPAYQWVDPPPALASTNTMPMTKTVTMTSAQATWDPQKGSAPGVYATDNYQTTLSLAPGAIGAQAGAREVVLRIVPQAPEPGAVVPEGYQIAGNVVRISATYRPTGGSVTELSAQAQLLLSYPAVFGGVDDTLLTSSDGTTWEALDSTNHLGQQLVVADIQRFGLFAVGQTSGSGSVVPTGSPQGVPVWVIALLGALAVAAGIAAVVARRGSRPSERAPREPRREDKDPFDPWKDD